MLPIAVASSAWVLAQVGETSEALTRLREGEQLLDRQATVGAVGFQGQAYHALGRAGLLLGRLDEARSLWQPRAQAIVVSPRVAAACAAPARRHRDPSRARSMPRSGEAYYRQALALAEPRGMRPLVAHCHLGLGKLYRRTGQTRAGPGSTSPPRRRCFARWTCAFWLEQADAAMKELPAPGRRRTNQ